MPLLSQPSPPALVAPAPSDYAEAETALLEALDWGWTQPAAPNLKGPAALDYRWLLAAASFNPDHGLPDEVRIGDFRPPAVFCLSHTDNRNRSSHRSLLTAY